MSRLQQYDEYLKNSNVLGLLSAIRHGEGTTGDAGYNTQFTGSKFDASQGWKHPRQIKRGGGHASDAAGAYQFLSTTWDGVAKELGLKDFSPRNQDYGALGLIERRGVNLADVAKRGVNADVLHKLAPEWASLPTKAGRSFYGQPVKSAASLLAVAGRGGRASSPAAAGSTTAAAPAGGSGGGVRPAAVSTPGVGQADDGGLLDPILDASSRWVDDFQRTLNDGYRSLMGATSRAQLQPLRLAGTEVRRQLEPLQTAARNGSSTASKLLNYAASLLAA